jgi:hypothetical protein
MLGLDSRSRAENVRARRLTAAAIPPRSSYNPRLMDAAPTPFLDPTESAFALRAVRRKRLFVSLSVAGLVVAAGYAAWCVWMKKHDPAFDMRARAIVVVLVLLNARQNLRQYRYACLIEKLLPTTR